MSNFAVILPAAGKSSRFKKGNRKKVFTDLKGRAVWLRAAEAFVNRKDVVQTIVVVAPDDIDLFKDRFRPNLAFMNIDLVEGGATRSESVQNGLNQVRDDVDFVAVHDAARPLIASDWIDSVFKAAKNDDAAILGVRITSTLKRVASNNVIEETVPREHLWAAQTPQVFRKQLLKDAYSSPDSATATDEASLLQQAGHKVTIVEGSPINIKITTNSDFRMAEFLLNAVPKDSGPRALHPFKDDDGLIF